MTAHTPGPWHPWVHDSNTITASDSSHVEPVCFLNNKLPPEVAAANGRLIAAAPDLLAALKDVVNAYQQHFDVMPVAWQTYDDIARVAIAKATGAP